MRTIFQNTPAIALCLLLAACGGGGGGEPAPVVNQIPVADMSACFQIDIRNSANQINVPGRATAVVAATAAVGTSTVYFSTSTFALTHRSENLAGATTPATVVRNKGLATYVGIPSAVFDNETFQTITPQSRTVNFGRNYDASGVVINQATWNGNVFDLTVVPGQSQTVTRTRNNSNVNFAPLAIRTVQTVNFVSREDVQTTAGLFKNACKVTFNGSTFDVANNALVNTFSETGWYAPGWGRVKANGTSDTPRYSPTQNSFTLDTLSLITGTF